MKQEQEPLAKIAKPLLTQIKRDKIRYDKNSVSEIIRLYRAGFLTANKLDKLLDQANKEYYLTHVEEFWQAIEKVVR